MFDVIRGAVLGDCARDLGVPGETVIALALILGTFSNLTFLVGVLLSVVIWPPAEGFGGPFPEAGSTGIGAAISYVLTSSASTSAGRNCSSGSSPSADTQTWALGLAGPWGLLQNGRQVA